jgi:hypothetical protein
MTNIKQQELANKLFKTVKKQFPEIEFIKLTRSPEDSTNIWVNVVPPKNPQRKIAMEEYAAELEIDILLKYGYFLTIIPNKREYFEWIEETTAARMQKSNSILRKARNGEKLRINFRQEELLEKLFRSVKKKFPEIDFVDLSQNPKDPEHIFVHVTAPEYEDREIALKEYAAEKSTDMLQKYGWYISIIPDKKFNDEKVNI